MPRSDRDLRSLEATIERVLADHDQGIDRVDLISSLMRFLEEHLHDSVELARAQRATWQRIGDGMGLTRQAAQQRFGRTTAK